MHQARHPGWLYSFGMGKKTHADRSESCFPSPSSSPLGLKSVFIKPGALLGLHIEFHTDSFTFCVTCAEARAGQKEGRKREEEAGSSGPQSEK